MEKVDVNLDGGKRTTNFEVITIVDETIHIQHCWGSIQHLKIT